MWLLLAIIILNFSIKSFMVYIGGTLVLLKIYERTYLSRNIQNIRNNKG